MMLFLLKGLLRDRSRSLFPILMVATGAFITVFLHSWLQGVVGGVVDSNAQFDTGHVKIITRAYNETPESMPNDLALVGVGEIKKDLENFDKEMIWTPRIRFGGLLDIPDEKGETGSQGPVMGLGVDLFNRDSPEYSILRLEKSIIDGRLPKNPREIVIGEGLAQKLRIGVGDNTTLLSSTMYGSMSVYNFKVSGIVRFGIVTLDKQMIIADISDIRQALDMEDAASEIVGYHPTMIYDDVAMQDFRTRFNKKFSLEEDEFSPLMLALSDQNNLSDMLAMTKTAAAFIVILFVTAMSLVLWNAGLMGNIRRYGEIGVRIAVGESKGALYRRMLFESSLIGIAGCILGTAFGLLISYYLQYTGVSIGSMMQKSTMLMANEIRAQVTPLSYVIGFMPGLVAPLLGTMAAGIGIYRRQTAQLFKELDV